MGQTFSMSCYEALKKCGPVLEEAPALFDKAGDIMVALGEDTKVPKIQKAGEQLTEIGTAVKKHLVALTETYQAAQKDYEEVGRLTGAL